MKISNEERQNLLLGTLKGPQKDIVKTLDRAVFVAAGAGSGKTFTLTRRIVWALCPGSGEAGKAYLDDLDQALIITYTNKAAGEIKERVRNALRQAGFTAQALKVDSAWISTIHGMCARILRENALDLGLDPDFGIAEEQRGNVLREVAYNKALEELGDSPELGALFAEYGAGTGSTAQNGTSVPELVSMLLNLVGSANDGFDSLKFVECGTSADLDASLALVIAAYERLSAYPNPNNPEEEASVKTGLEQLRAYAAQPLAKHSAAALLRLFENLAQPGSRAWTIKAAGREAKEAATELLASLKAFKAEVAFAHAGELQAPLMELTRSVAQYYAEAKRAEGLLDNDDLLQLCARAFREHPEIAERYTSKFKLVMVDEFQDTNTQQINMIKQLAGIDACHLATVGDAQQAIYGFRGADVRVFEERGQEVGESSIVHMDTNFRSDNAILRFVESACGKDTGIVPNFMDLHASHEREDHFAKVKHPRVIVEHGCAAYGSKPKADARRQVEAIQIADRLAALNKAGVEPRQMAILMRSTASAGLFIEALRTRGIESVVVGGSTFAGAPEVQTVAAFLHVLANPQDTKTGLFPVLESPMFDLDANDMVLLGTKPQEVLAAPAKRRIYPGVRSDAPVYEGLQESKRLINARKVLSRAWERTGKLAPADIVLMAMRESGWLARLEHAGAQGRATAANILRAIDHVRELSNKAGLNVTLVTDEFDRWLAGSKESPAVLSGEGSNAVSIMTAHASKGLEFDVVAVVGCAGSERSYTAPKLLSHRMGNTTMLSLSPKDKPDLKGIEVDAEPTAKSSALDWRVFMEAEAKLAEEREAGRLFYVALTRARECVILSLNTYAKKDGSLNPAMSNTLVDALGIKGLAPGECELAFSSEVAPALVRTCEISLAEDGVTAQIDSAKTLDEALDLFEGRSCTGLAATFDLFDVDAELVAPLEFWRPREGVFSYSSAHHVLQESEDTLALDDVLILPAPAAPCAKESARADLLPVDDYQSAKDKRRFEAPAQVSEDEPQEYADADRATNLGSAFHELARMMVETGNALAPERIEIVARNYGVNKHDVQRLIKALRRWEGSALRAEACGFKQLRAEVPFFCKVDSLLGQNLEGAIDLLATDGSDTALLIDYKTGDHGKSFAQIRVAHEMQACFYAYVLGLQGYKHITCAFVCVELEDDSGQPVVTRYEFSC